LRIATCASHKTKAFGHISFYNRQSESRNLQPEIATVVSLQSAIRNCQSPINRAMIIFITSVVPAAMDPMRTSRASRQIWYSSMYP